MFQGYAPTANAGEDVQTVQRHRASVIGVPRPLAVRNVRAEAAAWCQAVAGNVKRKLQDIMVGKKDAKKLRISSKPVKSLRLSELEASVISLARRPDRFAACQARLRAYCPWLQFSMFPACDGKIETMSETEVTSSWHTGENVVYQKRRAIRKGWDDLDSYQVRQLAMSPGEKGCAVSHIRCWRRCLELAGDTDRPLLVLEDDAAPTPEFTALLTRAMAALPSDADVLYLGYSQAAEWRREMSAELVEAEYVWTTVAYIVWPSGARRMLSALPIDQPVDNWMASMCAKGSLQSYCVRPKIVRQADAWNVNSDVAHSDEQYWGPCSDIHHSDEFYWGKPNDDVPAGSQCDGVDVASNAARAAGFLAGGSSLWDFDNDSEDSEA
eukprot:TRINITY_DN54228_c0_g1_i1.p1 TRINITY_DN54228_c0_g1~~TRINITY_DN54228_c0_g1_i1.p1  ORF type:complete len:382 (-),score=66.76 TRINITY_DN54228_c0_g1_i1:145-1290(-)